MLRLRPVIVNGEFDVEFLHQLLERRQRFGSKLQTIVGTEISFAYSNAARADASSFIVMTPQLIGVIPASRNCCTTCFRSSAVLFKRQMHVLDRHVMQIDPLDAGNRLIQRQFSETVRRDADFQSLPGSFPGVEGVDG